MTEQIKSVIQSLNSNQVLVVSCSFIPIREQEILLTIVFCSGWRTWYPWWNDSIRCCSSNFKQSTNFSDVDWWKGLYFPLCCLFRILKISLLQCLDCLLSIWSLSILLFLNIMRQIKMFFAFSVILVVRNM